MNASAKENRTHQFTEYTDFIGVEFPTIVQLVYAERSLVKDFQI